MGYYISENDVKIRLIGKVKFGEDDNDQNKLGPALIRRLIQEAESDVELDLSPRYETPIVGTNDVEFKKLSDRLMAKNVIRTLVELKAVERILDTDFGRGSATDGEKYMKTIQDRYSKMMDRLMARKGGKDDESTGFKYPPLLGIKLNYMNNAGDDGFAGMILVTSQGDGDFPQKQINDPSETWWNGMLDK